MSDLAPYDLQVGGHHKGSRSREYPPPLQNDSHPGIFMILISLSLLTDGNGYI